MRIFPALIAMLLLVVFVVGSFFTSLPLLSYLTSPKTYSYFLKCATLPFGVGWKLPGVFHFNPIKDAVNGSLWTMPYEIYMYGILAAVWLVLGARSIDRIKLITIAILTSTVASGVILLMGHLLLGVEIEGWFTKLFFMFFSGASIYVLKYKITLSRTAFWLSAMALMATTLLDKQLFFVVYVFTIAYVIFHLVYVPSGPIRRYNRLGDYSYGMYIYAFPIH